MTAGLERIDTFLRDQIQMSGVHQPVVLATLLRAGGSASLDDLAEAISAATGKTVAVRDVVRYPIEVLGRHGLVTRDGDEVRLTVSLDGSDPEEIEQVASMADRLIAEWNGRPRPGYERNGALAGFSEPIPFVRENLSGIPNEPGAHVVWDASGGLIYCGYTSTQRTRLQQHLSGDREASILHKRIGERLDESRNSEPATAEEIRSELGTYEFAWKSDDQPEALKRRIMEELAPTLNQVAPQATGRYWLFQANPRVYDFLADLENFDEGDEDKWTVSRYEAEMAPGDHVLFWLAGEEAGIYALGEISGPAFTREEGTYTSAGPGSERAVPVRYLRILDEPLLKAELREHPVLGELSVIKHAQGTNFKVAPEQWTAVQELIGDSGGGSVWWVNQGQTYRAERTGGYIWAPQTNKQGRPLRHHTDVHDVAPGAVIVHYSGGQLRAISTSGAGFEAPRPSELPGDAWSRPGFQANTRYYDLNRPIELTELDVSSRIEERGPFNRTGAVNQGYLYPLSPDFADYLRTTFADRWPADSPWGSSPDHRPPPPPGSTSPPSEDPHVIASSLDSVCSSFADAIRAANLSFGDRHDDFVRSFVVSLATKRFLLLTGLSGSGKTRIAIGFGEWLGQDRLKVVAVRPDWTGSDALLGFEDGLSEIVDGTYAWRVPEALEFMLRAARDPSNPYLLLLDEMNLSHVERYFAEVLSGMESQQPILPNLAIADAGHWRLVDGGPERLPIPPNLLIVGTVNIDETTYMFSPKVLDRANTIEFRVETDDLLATASPPSPVTSGAADVVAGFLAAATSSGVLGEPDPSVEAWLRDLHRRLAADDREFGHRVFFEALRFASLLRSAGEADRRAALDLQVMQKVLPRLHGSTRQVGPTLEWLAEWTFRGPDQPLTGGFDPLEPPDGTPQLPISFDKVRRMIVRLRANHFVSFAE